MRPTVGRIVHFYAPDDQNPDGNPFAAIVTAVRPNGRRVDLVTFGPGSIYFHVDVEPCADPKTLKDCPRWCWPPREGGAL